MKKGLLLVALLFALFQLNAQQEHQYTQFMYNKLLINPAYAGARGVPFVTALYRNQWAGFEGSPQSGLLSFNSPFLSQRVGIGFTVSANEIGLQQDVFANLAYSYNLLATDAASLRVGIMGSIRSLGFDFANAQPLLSGDNSLDNQRVNDITGNVGAGIYSVIQDQYYFGFSVPRIYSNKIGINDDPLVEVAKEFPHFYGMAGAIFPVSEDIKIMPAILAKYVQNAPFDLDINVNLDIKEKITTGLSYRVGGDGSGDSVDLLFYWQAHPQFGVGAAYDFPLSRIRDYTAGSFEVMLLADLKKKNQSKNLSNPRFFL